MIFRIIYVFCVLSSLVFNFNQLFNYSAMKGIIKILLIISVLTLLGFAGCKGFINHIYNRTDCEQMNIDNIELRTGIDIPAVSNVVCEFKTAEKTKVAVFTLDKAKVDLTHYTTKNDFIQKGNQYVKSGERTDTKWDASLDATTWDLTVSVQYK